MNRQKIDLPLNIKSQVIILAVSFLIVSCQKVEAPEPVYPLPSKEQVEWHKMENYAFIHFGLNTFNDLEWGYGNTPVSTFNPKELDCDQWVSTIKRAGLKAVILTAKHHDGFCLWPTATTNYNISNSPYKGGKGDLVKELSDACRRQGLKFGLYLSPWDRNNVEYGRQGYQKIYHAQINELISNYGPLFEFWFDGANGGNGWYGGSDEVRTIDPNVYYGYEEAREMIKAKHPNAMIFGGTVPDIRWIGNEQGWAGQTNWSAHDENKAPHYTAAQWGMEDADQWLPGECDVSIRPGWFYHHREDHQVKSVSKLVDLYYKSVGHNANFLLNFPVNLDGKISEIDSTNAVEAYETLKKEFENDLLEGILPESSSVRGVQFSASNVTDNDWNSYWATPDDVTSGELVFRFKQETSLNRVQIQEYIPLGQRVRSFKIETASPDGWLPVETEDSLTTIGYKRLVRFKTTSTDALKLSFTDARGPLCINTVKAFNAPRLLEAPSITRNLDGYVSIETIGNESELFYTLDSVSPVTEDGHLNKSNAIPYTRPFQLDRKAIVHAVTYDAVTGKVGPVMSKTYDIPARMYVKVTPSQPNFGYLFDDDGYTVFSLPHGNSEISLELSKPEKICGFVYTPNQRRDAAGHIYSYEFYVDGKLASKGEFSNVKNNPVAQSIHFDAIRGKSVQLKCIRSTGEDINIGGFNVITE